MSTNKYMKMFIESKYQMAIAGPTFSIITHEYPDLLDEIVSVCDVFARMAPDQKQQLVNHLQTVSCLLILFYIIL